MSDRIGAPFLELLIVITALFAAVLLPVLGQAGV